MKRLLSLGTILIVMWSILNILGLPGTSVAWASGQGVVIERNIKPAPKRGANMIRNEVKITFREGSLTYVGTARRDETRAITDKYGDHFLGLDFGQPPKTNGGWDRWGFLRVRVRTANGVREATSYNLLGDAYVLNGDSSHHVVAMRWPVGDQAATANQTIEAVGNNRANEPAFTLTLVEDTSMPHWLFIRVSVDVPATLERIDLSCYPGNTAGPEARQRWVATPGNRYNLSDHTADLADVPDALAFYNRFGQPRDGCLLVNNPGALQSLRLRGNNKVQAIFTPHANERAAVFALGYFIDADPHDAIRRFFRDTHGAVQRYLAQVDWAPTPDFGYVAEQIQFIDHVVTEHGTPEEIDQWTVIRHSCETARADHDPIRLAAMMRAMETFKQTLLKRVLSTFARASS